MKKKEKVIVAMSGGVDSSVAAAVALEQGFEVIGATLKLKHPDPAFSEAQHCANKSDELAIQQVVEKLGIEHHYLYAYPVFEEKVLRRCAEAYQAGRTPNPCCICNAEVKFGRLLELAKEVGAKHIMTGHYANVAMIDGRQRLLRGDDLSKDQTYFLYRLTREELDMLRFPVGALTKPEVRAMAAKLELATAKKPDSQDACFQVENECFGETLRRLFALAPLPGRFIYQGKTVGFHKGIHQYTIGQRKGLQVALGVPAYISKIDPATGNITLVTDQDELLISEFSVRDCVFHAVQPETFSALVQIRYRSQPVPAQINRRSDGSFLIRPDQPQRAVTAGQSAVFYLDNLLLGGGVIDVD